MRDKYLSRLFQHNLGSSTAFLFLVLRWMDNAFENITSLHELFHLESKIPAGRNGLCLPYNDLVRSMPILRRTLGHGSSQISQTFAWSSGSALNQLKRVCEAGGWPQRMTPYCIRRGVLNKLDGKSIRPRFCHYEIDKNSESGSVDCTEESDCRSRQFCSL